MSHKYLLQSFAIAIAMFILLLTGARAFEFPSFPPSKEGVDMEISLSNKNIFLDYLGRHDALRCAEDDPSQKNRCDGMFSEFKGDIRDYEAKQLPARLAAFGLFEAVCKNIKCEVAAISYSPYNWIKDNGKECIHVFVNIADNDKEEEWFVSSALKGDFKLGDDEVHVMALANCEIIAFLSVSMMPGNRKILIWR